MYSKDESAEPNIKAQEKTQAEGESSRKARFTGFLKDNPIKGFNTEALKRPLTGMFRKTGKAPKKKEEEEVVEPTIAAPPTSFPNMPRVVATLESVELNAEDSPLRDRNSDSGSKLTLSDAPKFAMNSMHPMTRLFKVGDVDISILARAFPKEKMKDEDTPWTAQSLFNSLEARVKKEKLETKDQEPHTRNREGALF
ncbi:unnamed protein product [Caenorhabditis sp. 36 PRJEB53466]|nr:unnamed protein product [Caenorhabditis sp. 36 PRJEB53466]